MSTAPSGGNTPQRRSWTLVDTLFATGILALFIGSWLPTTKRLNDLEERIKQLEPRLDQSKEQAHP